MLSSQIFPDLPQHMVNRLFQRIPEGTKDISAGYRGGWDLLHTEGQGTAQGEIREGHKVCTDRCLHTVLISDAAASFDCSLPFVFMTGKSSRNTNGNVTNIVASITPGTANTGIQGGSV